MASGEHNEWLCVGNNCVKSASIVITQLTDFH